MVTQHQYPTDFDGKYRPQDIIKIFETYDFYDGRMIGNSKHAYRKHNENHLIVFNANIVIEKYGKIWYGDLDLTNDYLTLKNIANCIGSIMYVLYEMDARFGEENNSTKILINKSIWNTNEIDIPTLYWARKRNDLIGDIKHVRKKN